MRLPRHLALAFRTAAASSLRLLRRHRVLTSCPRGHHRAVAVVLVDLRLHSISLPNLLHSDPQPQLPPASDRCDDDMVVDLRCY